MWKVRMVRPLADRTFQLRSLEAAAAEQAEKARLTRRELEVVKQESEQMLKLMESMERKLRDEVEGREA